MEVLLKNGHLPYCHIIPLRPGDSIFSVSAFQLSSQAPQNVSREHIVKVAHIISKGSWVAKAMMGIVPQERRRLLKKIKPRD